MPLMHFFVFAILPSRADTVNVIKTLEVLIAFWWYDLINLCLQEQSSDINEQSNLQSCIFKKEVDIY